MIYKWLNGKDDGKSTLRSRNVSSASFGDFEQLEDKRCLAFLGFFDGVTLDIVQTEDDGDIVIAKDIATGIWSATDNVQTFQFVDPTHVTVELLDNTANRLEIQIDQIHGGDLTVDLGNGTRDVFFTGVANEIDGDLVINSGDDSQVVGLTADPLNFPAAAPLVVHGSAEVNLGEGDDTLTSFQTLVTVDVDLTLRGVNEFEYNLTVGLPAPPTPGDVLIDNSFEDVESAITGNGSIFGSFTYIGGENIDTVDLGGSLVVGDININLGEGNPFFGSPQIVNIQGQSEGDIIIEAGDSEDGNEITVGGVFLGNIVSYTGGDTVDLFLWEADGAQADVFVDFGAGNDVFSLDQQVNLLEIDFGNDVGDQFINNLTENINFEFDITNFHFFDHFYTAINDRLVMNQLADTGDLIVDNDGGAGTDWRAILGIGGESTITTASNLVLNLLPNTGNNLEVDLVNPVLSSIEINVGDGDRNIEFTGISNNPLRDITITAGAGDQFVDLSVNQPLGVATLSIDLGMGFDTVEDSTDALIVDEDLFLIGVNQFEHTGIISVFRDFVVDTSFENQDTLISAGGSLFVGQDFLYTGGNGADQLLLNGAGGSVIRETAIVDLGSGLANDQTLDVSNAEFRVGLDVSSSNTSSVDNFISNDNSVFFTDLSIDLDGGTNNAVIDGTLNGTSVNYAGTFGVDTVTYGLGGAPANLNVSLGSNDDVFNLLAGASINSPLTIDFGTGDDVFNSTFGEFSFDADLRGLNGFDHLYTNATNTLVSTQVEAQGDVVIDNNGFSNAIRFVGATNTTALTPVDNLVVQLLDGMDSLDVVFDNSFDGNLTVELGAGARTFNLSGTSNIIGGDLSVSGTDGDQAVELAVNQSLVVGGNAQINLGSGFDSVDEDARNIAIGGNFELNNVNTLESNALLNVGGDLIFDVSSEQVASSITDASTLLVVGDFVYSGNNAADSIIFNNSTNVGGDVTINAFNGDNIATLINNVDGDIVTYLGGEGIDTVSFGTTGNSVSLNVDLAGGDDVFTLEAGNNLAGDLVLDFGTGADTFINNYGPFNFNATLLGLSGFDHEFNFADGTLTSVQTDAVGNVTVDDNGEDNSIRFTTVTTSVLGPISNLNLTLLDGGVSDLTVDFDATLQGDLTLALGDGSRTVSLTGDSNRIGGALDITGGAGTQIVNAAINNNLEVGFNDLLGAGASVDLGNEVDTFNLNGNTATIQGQFELANVNDINLDSNLSVSRNLNIDNSADNVDSSFIDNAMIDVAGEFNYFGGASDDIVTLSANSTIGGDITVDGDEGENSVSLLAAFNGVNIDYFGGSGTDNVTLGTTGTDANVNLRLQAGDDSFTLEADTDVSTDGLRVDFGGGNDSITNNFGQFDFNASLLNLDGFTAFYNLATGNLSITQVSEAGDLTIDNNGADSAIRFGVDGELNELTAANDLRIRLQDGDSDVIADFDNVRDGITTVQLVNGDRDVFLTGDSNTYNGLLRFEASDGVQNIHLAVNADLNVDGTLIVNLRDESDAIFADNAVNVTGALLLRNVNTFVNNNGVNVGGDFNIITLQENEDTRLISNTSLSVGGNVSYLGGGGLDNIDLRSSTDVGGFFYADLSTAANINARQRLVLSGGFNANFVSVRGDLSAGGTFISTDQQTNVATDFIVNLTDTVTVNTILIEGSFGGTYGTVRGGSAADVILIGITAPIMEFVVLTGSGADNFIIEDTTDVDFLFADLGNGVDNVDIRFENEELPFDNFIFNV